MRPAVLRVLICFVWILIIGLVWLSITIEKPLQPQLARITPTETSTPTPTPETSTSETPTPEAPTPTPDPPPSPSPFPSPLIPPTFVGQIDLIIPVAGVRPEQLLDTFDDARSEGRVHDAIDIMAPAGTPVIAATEGKIVKLFQSERGGTTIYQLSPDEKTVYYYAHLQGYAQGLAEGGYVRRGDVIAYVGDTGNAGAGNYHLHFSISAVSDPKRYWEGTSINPYPLLRR
jgi:murein DD-endopeptidase MepM/ murein hydrolase activator NlpD